MLKLTTSEDAIFNTIQGEGKYAGYPSTFVRLSMCNLRCQWKNKDGSFTTCDTPHTSFDPVIEKHEVEDIVKKITSYGTKHVVVTGGEPFFQKQVSELIDTLVDCGHIVTVETNGTLYRPNKAQFLSISPKLSSSSSSPVHGKKHEKQRLKIPVLLEMLQNHDCQFKFVVNEQDDLLEITDIADQILAAGGPDINDLIWLMPQGVTDSQFNEKMVWIADLCKIRQWKLADRLHIRIWGARKGV